MELKSKKPKIVPGFNSYSLLWSKQWHLYSVKVKPGEFYVANDEVVITTVLGSCISACVFDDEMKLGGLNHFMLPNIPGQTEIRCLRYGLFAMEQLINEMMKLGCTRQRMQVKVTGGGDMLGGDVNIGEQNIAFIQQYLLDEKLQLVSQDVGGDRARKVAYFPTTGRMLVNKLSHRDDQQLIKEESSYRVEADHQLDEADVELF